MEDTTVALARTERALDILRREVEALRCERLQLLAEVEFLAEIANRKALDERVAVDVDLDAPAQTVALEEQEISWLDGDTQPEPSNVHRLPRRRTKSEACIVVGEIRCA